MLLLHPKPTLRWVPFFLLFLLLQNFAFAVFNPANGKKEPQGPLGVTLDYAFTTSWLPDGPPKNNDWPLMFSSRLTFKNSVSEITDGQLWKIVEDAHNEMLTDVRQYGIGPRRAPFAMSVMAVGNEIYLSSSQRGPSSFTYNYGDTPVLQVLRMCQIAWREKGNGDSEHDNHGKCGEIMVAHQYYTNHPNADQALGLQNPQVRLATIVSKSGNFVRYLPCPEHEGPQRDPSRWGCNHYIQSQGFKVLDVDDKRLPKQDYNLDTLAGGLATIDQVPICAGAAPRELQDLARVVAISGAGPS